MFNTVIEIKNPNIWARVWCVCPFWRCVIVCSVLFNSYKSSRTRECKYWDHPIRVLMRDEDEILPHSLWAGGRSPVDPITQLSSNRKYTMTNECVCLCVCVCVQMVIKFVFGFQVIHSCLFNRPCRSINAIFSAHTLSSCTRLWLPWAALGFHTPTVWEGAVPSPSLQSDCSITVSHIKCLIDSV